MNAEEFEVLKQQNEILKMNLDNALKKAVSMEKSRECLRKLVEETFHLKTFFSSVIGDWSCYFTPVDYKTDDYGRPFPWNPDTDPKLDSQLRARISKLESENSVLKEKLNRFRRNAIALAGIARE